MLPRRVVDTDRRVPPHIGPIPLFLKYAPGLVVVGAAVVGAFLSDHRWWGVNHLSFLPVFGRTVAVAVLVLGLISPMSRSPFAGLAQVARWCMKRPSRVRAFLVLGASTACVLFLAFSSSTLLLGDGGYLAGSLREAVADSVTVGDNVRQVIAKERIYPGTLAMYFLVSQIAVRLGASDAIDGVKANDAFLGALFILIPLGFFCRSRMPFPGRLLVSGLVLTSGALALFFGYVEVYAPLTLLVAVFCASGFGVILARWSLWWPTLCVVIGIILHVQVLLLLPGLVFLLFYRGVGQGRLLNAIALAIAAACVAGIVVLSQFDTIRRLILPVWDAESSYSILSTYHILDVANEVMLIVPGTPLVVALLLIMWNDGGVSRQARWNSLLRALRSPDVLFAGMLAIPTGLFLWVLRPELGMARDWDLFSISGVGIVSIAYVTAKRVTQHRWDELMKFTIPSVLLASIVLTSTWIVVNAAERMSVARYVSILRYDTTNGAYAYENLWLHSRDRGDVAGEIRALEHAVKLSPNPRYWFNLGLGYYSVGEREKGLVALRTTLRSHPEFGEARRVLAQMLYSSREYKEMVSVCLEGERLVPADPYYPLCVGQGYASLGQWTNAREAFSRCLALGPSPEIIHRVQEILERGEHADK